MDASTLEVAMHLSVKALAIAGATVLGGSMFLVAIGNIGLSGYGDALLAVAASIYPGYHGPGGVASAFVVGLYATLDGAVAGALIALVHNAVVHRGIPKGERFSA
ncbi:MAG: hypothetical protein IH616_09015 [Gemmatimonadales bacterium]|nr:hypothetical protein [Gemmatimonadales bacterium]